VLTILLGGLAWFSFFNTAAGREATAYALDAFDSRPARSILFIGNSRTFPYGMPYMVREMADSAGAARNIRSACTLYPAGHFASIGKILRFRSFSHRNGTTLSCRSEARVTIRTSRTNFTTTAPCSSGR
jgi:hypothetical protein